MCIRDRAVTDVLIHKALKALRASGHRTLAISGGVSCNRELRSRLKTACDREKVELVLPDFDLTTDKDVYKRQILAFFPSLMSKTTSTKPGRSVFW